MKKLLILAFALVIATSAFAAGPAKIKADYTGIVEKYDAASKTLTVRKKDKTGEFVITDASVVELNKAKANASAITAGQKVNVEFTMDGSKKVAQTVKLTAATSK